VDETGLTPLAFLAGGWRTANGPVTVEEHWTSPEAGSMLGCGRMMRDGETVLFEFLRIEQNGDEVVYHASPLGRAATPFHLAHAEPGLVVFENLEHDFPQRIVYRLRDDGVLHARTESEDGERGSDFVYARIE